MSEEPSTVEKSLTDLVEVLWEIKHELTEIRRIIALPEYEKENNHRNDIRKRYNQL